MRGGGYQAGCPMRLMSAGMSVIRMRKASMRTPAVSLAPVHTAALRDRYGVVMRQIRRRQP